ncbi:MAG: hypothetical protein IKG04_08435 [Exiguobacterium sp.]|nr:hypothetical protein [Exiguobacterium sp.]
MSIYSVLQGTHLPCVYSHFKTDQTPPYIVYIGSGQNTSDADNTHYWRENTYQVEYYFTTKDESNETAIEDALLGAGYLYTKSEDVYIEDEGVFVIYYQV